MKQRRTNATLTIAGLALTLLIVTVLPRASTAAPRLERQLLESLTVLNSSEVKESGAPSQSRSAEGIHCDNPFFIAINTNGEMYAFPTSDEPLQGDFVGNGDVAAVADFDNDGFCEVLAARQSDRFLRLYESDGGTGFVESVVSDDAYPSEGFALVRGRSDSAAGDFDNNNLLDFAFTGRRCASQFCPPGGQGLIQLHLNHGSGHFERRSIDVTGFGSRRWESMHGLDDGDFNEDGSQDLAAQQYWCGSNNITHLFAGNGDGTFMDSPSFTRPDYDGTSALLSGDFNKDGHLDLIVGQDDADDPGQTWLYLGDGTGAFAYLGPAYDTNPAVESGDNRPGGGHSDAYDFDTDGNLDAIAAANEIGLLLFKGNGDGTFQSALLLHSSPNWVGVATPSESSGAEPGPSKPVVLVHGHQILGIYPYRCSYGVREWGKGSDHSKSFGEMALWLKEDSFDVWVAHYDTGWLGTPSLEKNAACLRDQIAYVKLVTKAEQVILVAHSMGGLVSRAYIEGHEYKGDVERLFTLGSPHAGIHEDFLKKFIFGPALYLPMCRKHKGLCQSEEEDMETWNKEHSPKSHVKTPPYYLIGGDKSDSFFGWKLRDWADPNDGFIGTRSAQALKGSSSAIQSDVQGRYQTHESHSERCCGSPSYFQPLTGQDHSQSYQCIQNELIREASNPCTQISSATMLAQAAPRLTEYASDVRGQLNTGETAEHTLQVDTGDASLFYLSWVTGTLGLTLTNPIGTIIDPAYAAANTDVVTYTTSPGSEMMPPFAAYDFTTTVPGLYTATITAGDVDITGTDYLLFAAMETTRTLSVALDSNYYYQIGDIAVLTATLEGSGGGIAGATVQATFSRSDSITDTLTLIDQGDGTYRGTYAIPTAPGYLHLRVTAEGSDAGTQFSRQVDRLLAVASQAVQLTGTYADRADDADGNGRYEALIVDVEVLAAGAGDFTFSANLVNGGGQFVAHVITQTALITGTQSVPLTFDGDLIHEGGSDGPFTVTNLLISDLQNAGIPSVMADDVWITAAYDHTQFGRITGDMNGDCIVTVVDIMLVVSRWNTTIGDIHYDATYDLDDSGDIDVGDIMFVAAHWRETCG